jgi:hypothetical protein
MRCSSTILCVIFGLAAPAAAVAQTEITSTIESVMVYPDGATVTRRIRVDLPQGDSVLRAVFRRRSTLRRCEARARLTHHRGNRCKAAARGTSADGSGT